MKLIGSKIVLTAAVLVIAFSTTGRTQDLQAKIEFCNDCHGLSGQGYRGYLSIPRLAGQPTEYFENQLRAFAEHRRQSKMMYDVARTLNPGMRRALAAHFRDLNPRPLGGAPKGLVETGKKIYEEGIPESNVPACMACHGQEGKGQEAIPRLAGQLHEYIIDKLVNWSSVRGRDSAKADTTTVMAATSHAMTRPQIAAVAAYVSYQH